MSLGFWSNATLPTAARLFDLDYSGSSTVQDFKPEGKVCLGALMQKIEGVDCAMGVDRFR